MPYLALKALFDANRDWMRVQITLPPLACPICGTPLEMGQITENVSGATSNSAVRSMLRNCPMGHYTWRGGPNPMP